MKVIAAIGVYVAFAALLSAGIVLAVHGKYTLLLLGSALFGLLFWRVGCRAH
jgi:hypothetical protein